MRRKYTIYEQMQAIYSEQAAFTNESGGLLMSTLDRETNNDFTGVVYTDVMLMCCSCTYFDTFDKKLI